MRLRSGVGCVDRKGQALPHLSVILNQKKMVVQFCALRHIVIRIDGCFLWDLSTV